MRLLECYFPVVHFACEIATLQSESLSFEDFRQQILQRFADAEQACQLNTAAPADIEDATFAMAVWFDEMILRSTLPFKPQWRTALLQTHFFNTVIGGEAFFTRLDNIPEENTALRRVYLHCLLMGFHGKYHLQDSHELIKRIKDERQSLPDGWENWPNQLLITPMNHPRLHVQHGVIQGWMRDNHAMVIGVAVNYLVLSALLIFY